MVQIVQDVIKNYERNEDRIRCIEEELNDLNHEIELTPSKNMYSGYLLYKSIRELRIERRRCKEENELMKDMYEYFKGQQGQAFKNKIQSIQSNAAKLREVQEHRTYTPRQRNDLTCTEQTSTAHKPFQEMLDEFNKNKAYMKNGKLRK
jgi:hypothetical protein